LCCWMKKEFIGVEQGLSQYYFIQKNLHNDNKNFKKDKNMAKFFLNKSNFTLGVHQEVHWDASWDG